MAQFQTAEMTVLNSNGIRYKLICFEEDLTHSSLSPTHAHLLKNTTQNTFKKLEHFKMCLLRSKILVKNPSCFS